MMLFKGFTLMAINVFMAIDHIKKNAVLVSNVYDSCLD